jgi:hypothetical protein
MFSKIEVLTLIPYDGPENEAIDLPSPQKM